MKVLVTGVNGQLGYDVMQELKKRGYEGIGAGSSPAYHGIADEDISSAYVSMDITDPDRVDAVMRAVSPDAVIHCAAWTAVDRAEDEYGSARSVNTDGARNIAAACRTLGAKMLYISTDYVFPGDGSRFYEPEDATGPLGAYGMTKLGGELAVRELLDRFFIVRVSWVFGLNGGNFVRTMLRLAQTHSEVSVVCDQIGSPTYTADLAPLLCDMIESEKYGIYHATNEGICSWADFAAEIFRLAGKPVTVRHIPTSEYPTRAVRPLNSRMSKDKLDAAGFARLPSWQDALARYVKELG